MFLLLKKNKNEFEWTFYDNYTMNYEISENVCMYCFVSVSTVLLWGVSVMVLPDERILHVLNLMGILFHFLYYLYFCKIVFVFHMLYIICFMIIHYFYIFQIGIYVFQIIFMIHLLFLWILIYTRSTYLFIVFSIMVEILTRNLCIATYVLLSCSHPIFYFSGYTKIK